MKLFIPTRIFSRSILTLLCVILSIVCMLMLSFSGGSAASSPFDGQTSPGRTNPNTGLFPDSSLVDFGFLLHAPAGKYGFLQTGKQGHFYWSNGKRTRFWGINISSQSIFCDHQTIDKVTNVLARAGVNLVRFEAMDSTDGILDIPGADNTLHLDKNKLDTLDYWTSLLRKKGIYYYFDLLDFRQFKPGDGVPAWDKIGRAARPYAVFDPRLIELQKEYAKELLTHTNHYTHLRYVDDPALAMLEVCNEQGLFMKSDMLEQMAEPYKSELNKMWNQWLLQQYGSRDALKLAWGAVGETPVLADGENPSANTVQLALLTPSPSSPDPNVVDIHRAPMRLRDTVHFFYDLQRTYFHSMHAYLREIGLKIPITGVVSSDIIPDVASAGEEMDFTAENYYADHPAFSGKEWQGTFYYNDTNPLNGSSVYQIAPWLAGLRWENKPVVVREWATVWPNKFRCIAIPEMAAYAAYEDYDAVLLFGYQIHRKPEMLSDFDHQADPTVWGLFGIGAMTFLRGDIRPAVCSADIQYGSASLFRWPNSLTSLYRLAWFARLNNTLTGGNYNKALHHILLSPDDPGGAASALEKLKKTGVNVSGKMAQSPIISGPPGQITRRMKDGLLTLLTPTAAAVCGNLPVGKPIHLGPFTLISQSPIGALMAVSLDGQSLSKSKTYVVKMVTIAQNTDQSIEPSQPGAPGKIHLSDWGHAPVLTLGKHSSIPLYLSRNGKNLIAIGMTNGVWEIYAKKNQATLVCDTPGIKAYLFGQNVITASGPLTIDLKLTKETASNK
jgi:hypothetical protein